MSAFGSDIFEPASITQVALDLYTTDYRVSGTVSTRFTRVADILNQVTLTHIPLVHATISEYGNPTGTLGAEHVHVPVAEVLFCVASTDGGARPEMRLAMRPIKAQIAVPPFRLTGNVHVTQASRPVDGLLNALSAGTLSAGDLLRRIQNGRAQDYVYGVACGLLALLVASQIWR